MPEIVKRVISRNSGKRYNGNITYTELGYELDKLQQKFMFYVADAETLNYVDLALAEIVNRYQLDVFPLLTPDGRAIKGFTDAEYQFPNNGTSYPVALIVEYVFDDCK